ncbi:MAG: hypothetical protein NWT12_12790 [Paracoccaceae bacterium]|nr:hypothetical protein [Paracoccaceae bacterium]
MGRANGRPIAGNDLDRPGWLREVAEFRPLLRDQPRAGLLDPRGIDLHEGPADGQNNKSAPDLLQGKPKDKGRKQHQERHPEVHQQIGQWQGKAQRHQDQGKADAGRRKQQDGKPRHGHAHDPRKPHTCLRLSWSKDRRSYLTKQCQANSD